MLQNKSIDFASRIIKLCQFLQNEKKEFVLSKQILRSGTSIGANIAESKYAESRSDFKHKLMISLKEANETIYWLILLKKGLYIDEKQYISLYNDGNEIKKILIKSTKTLKSTPNS
ncbi:four helix bundle protein [Flammeovirga pacifica]|uniref:Four helix bundle protein n=1 Tax=Flammeovirga pacifica TaxID=915059 RepID=A0A1S1YWZ0_FLAPC|nr:four helix bundle protein [Flammeovirga pacifica]OHX65531.1 four helix bundle protein [Flammeovirga pacifica]